MRRATLRQMMVNNNGQSQLRRHHHSSHRARQPGWQQTTPPDYDPPNMEDYVLPHRCPTSANVAVNINVQFTPNANSQFTSLLVTPPPYAEVHEPVEDEAPPPYSTLDRCQGRHPTKPWISTGALADDGASSSCLISNDCSREEIDMTPVSRRDLETGQTDSSSNPDVILENTESPAGQRGLLNDNPQTQTTV